MMILFNLLLGNSCSAQRINRFDLNYQKYMQACDKFVGNYKPYPNIKDKGSFISQEILMPPDSINEFLFYCISNNDFAPLKFGIVMLYKHGKEDLNRNFENGIIGTMAGCENGFVEMIKIKMGMPRYYIDKDISEKEKQCWFPKYIHQIIIWAKENKEDIIDYKYIEQILNDK